MSNLPVFRLKATTCKNELSYVTEVVNRRLFEFYLYVEIPKVILHNCYRLYEVEEIGEHENFVCPCENVEYMGGPWYRFSSVALNMHPGQHVYRMHMIDPITNDVASVLFSYILQDDHPDKPYDYMDRDGKGACCYNVDSTNRVS